MFRQSSPRLILIRLSIAVGLLASYLFLASNLVAGEFNLVRSIGDAAPVWQELPATDGTRHSLGDLSDQEIVVVAFTCNSCPYAVDVEDRLIALANKYKPHKAAVVAINVNKVKEDLLPEMKKRSEVRKFNFIYLFDESQQIAREFGAKTTPEFFVLDRNRRIVYMGAFDDSPDGKNVTKRYLADAIDATLRGQSPTVKETVPIGCRIRFEQDLRRRSRDR